MSSLDYVQIILSIGVVLLSSLAPLRDNHKFTRWGKVLAVVAFGSMATSFVQIWNARQTAEDEHYRFDAISIQITLDAQYYAPEVPEEKFLENAPKEISVRSAELGTNQIDFEMISTSDVWHSPRSRVLSSGTVTYVSGRLRQSGSSKPLAFEHIWDLNGQKLAFHIPIEKFQRFVGQRDWVIRGTVMIGGKTYQGFPNDQGNFTFELAGLSEDAVKNMRK